MRNSSGTTPLAMFLCLIICLFLVSGCTSLRGNSNPPALITDVPTTISPAPPAAAPGGACAEGQTTCSGACRNTLVDSSNCGRCGNTCSASQYCNNGACTAGTMVIPAISLTTGTPAPGTTCASGQTLCSGVCRNTQADTSNCGTCGHTCGSGQTCSSGACSGTATLAVTTTATTTTTAPTTTAAATTIITTGSSCVASQMNCGGSCVSRHSDSNCGSCGNACGTGKQCFWSTAGDGTVFDIHCDCTAGSGLTLCSGTCVNLQNNGDNCGSCGHACQEGMSCISGVCHCPSGHILCGRCINPSTDSQNCAGCGNICPVGQHCYSGICISSETTPPACGKDLTLCSAAKGGTACVNLNTDSNNCGSCGYVCTTGSCSGGTCSFVLK